MSSTARNKDKNNLWFSENFSEMRIYFEYFNYENTVNNIVFSEQLCESLEMRIDLELLF
jgi:hypothetical protein